MVVNVDVDPEQIVTRKTDDRGRLNLGTQNSGKIVSVAILKVEEGEDIDDVHGDVIADLGGDDDGES